MLLTWLVSLWMSQKLGVLQTVKHQTLQLDLDEMGKRVKEWQMEFNLDNPRHWKVNPMSWT